MTPNERSQQWISWVLRIGVVMEFVGHGTLGLGRVAAWTSYFAVVGISKSAALGLMPLVGAFDVAMAVTVLFYPMRAVILYMALWGLWTALLRPLAGESAWEAVERAGNVGALAALFVLAGGSTWRSWLRFEPLHKMSRGRELLFQRILQLTTFLLLAGHGALGLLVRKPLLITHYAALGIHAAWVEPVVGAFECFLALAVLARPGLGLLAFVVIWKLATEALAPMAGSPIWVFIEHGGSYAAPLALAIWTRATGGTPAAAGAFRARAAATGQGTHWGSRRLEPGRGAGQLVADLALDDLAQGGILGG
jgi:hypothetical protein